MQKLLKDIRNCKVCEKYLKDGVNPVLSVSSNSKIIIIGQAPGKAVHISGVPWDDKSGDNLRNWLGVSKEQFYDDNIFGIVPIGFCYPGKGKSGDLPPRKECAPLWHQKIFDKITKVDLIILIGQYAQKYYLKDKMQSNLTETVRNYKTYLPQYLPLPHPSPRNNIWLSKNRWFENELLPEIQTIIKNAIKK